ncbi:MAG: DivIVA domain-containing protein [Actinomycetaceae bacterium]|nr:DivIVA domain-containing protein [Actinomycetaceae bacterium]
MSEDVFNRQSRFRKGYDIEQVNKFFEFSRTAYEGSVPAEKFSAAQIRCMAFDMVRGGYVTKEVDAALDRLELAFVKRDRANEIAKNGQESWNKAVADRATTLYPRMLRPHGERFAHPRKGKGYSSSEVDAFIDRLIDFFDHGAPLTAHDVRKATFRAERGNKAYEENVVDTYLARAVEILLAVE